jgi:hypothetical protein
MRKKQRAAQVAVGTLVLLFPFIGVPLPYAWEASFLYVLGVAVIALAFPIGDVARAYLKRSCCDGEGCEVCQPGAAPLEEEPFDDAEPAPSR